MIQKAAISFDVSSFNKIKKEITVIEEPIFTIGKVVDQFIIIKWNLAKDHHKESLKFEQEYQQLVWTGHRKSEQRSHF